MIRSGTDIDTMTSSGIWKEPRAVGIEFGNDAFTVRLADGRELSVPLEWFPRLRDASPEQRRHHRMIGNGIGIHWEDIDEDISVEGLL
jgi:hypothetical protein